MATKKRQRRFSLFAFIRCMLILTVCLSGWLLVLLQSRETSNPYPPESRIRFPVNEKEFSSKSSALRNEASFMSSKKSKKTPVLSPQLKRHLNSLPDDSVHVMVHDDGRPYQTWQVRVHYHNFVRYRAPWMQGYTRLMHRTRFSKTDDQSSPATTTTNYTVVQAHLLSGLCEVPTVQIEPFESSCETTCAYPPKERIHAMLSFLRAAQETPELIQGRWIMLMDPDMLLRYPVPHPGRASNQSQPGRTGVFGYMNPQLEPSRSILQRLFGFDEEDLKEMPWTGLAPTWMRVEDWIRVLTQVWRHQKVILADPEASREFGFAQDMWAFTTALSTFRLPLIQDATLMHAPPFYQPLEQSAPLIHYSYGLTLIYRETPSTTLWHFNKRDFMADSYYRRIPLPPSPPLLSILLESKLTPAYQEHLQWAFSMDSYATVEWYIGEIRRAAHQLPVLHWDPDRCLLDIPFL